MDGVLASALGTDLAGANSTTLLLSVYCVAIIFSSLLGGFLPSMMKLTHTRLQLMISLIGGLMLGVGLLHQLPHAVAVEPRGPEGNNLDWCLGWMLCGLVLMFFLLRWFHFHHHEAPEVMSAEGPATHPALPPHDHDHQHDHDHSHDHKHDHDHDHRHDHDHGTPIAVQLSVPQSSTPQQHQPHIQAHNHGPEHGHAHAHGHAHHSHAHGPTAHAASWVGVAIGLSLHTLFDGVALAAHVQADALHNHGGWLLGFGTFVGIALHKPLDSLSITSLMLAGGWSARARTLMNFAYALMCPLGAILLLWGLSGGSGSQALWVGSSLAFSAGLFVCIALSDLLPEIDFHSHDRVRLSLALVVGVVLAWAIGYLEPEHAHGHAHEQSHSHPHAPVPDQLPATTLATPTDGTPTSTGDQPAGRRLQIRVNKSQPD